MASLDHEFTSRDYDFPRLYVEGEESREYMLIDLERRIYRITRDASDRIGSERVAGLVPYEAGWNVIFDPIEARITRPFAVLVPWREHEALYAREGLRVSLVEVTGIHVNLVAREGEEVGEKDVLAYVVTGKGETRTIRAGVEGLILYIAWDPGAKPERYVYLIVDQDDAIVLRPHIDNKRN